jgi:hypothetical protein
MSDKCPCEQDVAVLTEKLKQYDRELRGNGREGVLTRFVKVEKTVSEMNDTVESIRTSLSGIHKSRETELAIQKDREKRQKKRERVWQIIGIVFGMIIGIPALIDFVSGFIQ